MSDEPSPEVEFAHLSSEPAPYRVAELDSVPVHHLTVVLRNQRVRDAGGSEGERVLSREFIEGEDWEGTIDDLCRALHGRGEVQLRFIGEGVDPWGTSAHDEEAVEHAASAAVIASFEGDRAGELRRAVVDFLHARDLDNCWFLLSPAGGKDVVVHRDEALGE